MAQIYVNLINKGFRTLEQVPGLWQEGVRQLLEETKE